MRRNKKKRIIIISLIGILALMTAGYAAFQTNLDIKGTSKISSNWNVLITNVTESNKEGEAETVGTPSWTDLTAYMEANLYQRGDSIEYDVTVENRGTIDAKLDSITDNIKTTNEAVKITFSGYTKGEKLYKNTSKIIKVKIEYNPDFTGTPEEGSGEISVDLNYTQAEGGTETPIETYLVNYDCMTNGGKVCSNYNEYLKEGDSVNLGYTATKEGYEFIGWNTDKDANTGLEELQVSSGEAVLYAIYRKPLSVTYTKGENVETIGKESDSCYLYNKENTCEITLPQITTGNDYISDGWYKDGEKIGDASEKYSISSNITLQAQAKLNKYTLTYNYNGATGGNSETSKQVQYNAPYGTLPTPTRSYSVTYNYNGATGGNSAASSTSNYTFNGWYKESTLTTKINSTDNYTLTSNSTIYAGWTSTAVTLPTPTKTGYTFNGWYSDSGLTTKVGDAGSSYKPTKAITLYAKWVDNIKPTVSLNPNTQTTYVKSKAVTVNLADAGSGLKASQNIYYAWSTSNTTAPSYSSYVTTTNTAGAKSASVTIPATSNSSLTGSYYLWIKVGTLSDVAGNTNVVKTSAVFKFDNTKPTVSLNPNTQSTYVKSKAVTVNLADSHSGLPASQKIYYAWSTSNTTAPSYSSYLTTTNTAGATSASVTVPATSNSSLTGNYYLWIKVGTLSDTLGNTSVVKTSAVFKFDNTKPTGSISFTGSQVDNVYYYGSSVGTTPYASSSTSDSHSGVKSSTLSCKSGNTTLATVSAASTSKTNITINSRKGTSNSYHYLQETTTITCTLSITDNAGNTNSASKSITVGNGWYKVSAGSKCSNYNTQYTAPVWSYINNMKKVTGWLYTYWSRTNATLYYYMDSSGTMLRNWQKINSKWYFLFDPCEVGGSTSLYYTNSGYDYADGSMMWNDTLTRRTDSAKWTFDANGACTSGSGC